MELRLEMVTVPVADVDRAKAFYVERVGFSTVQDVHIDAQHRFVELLRDRGVEVSEIQEYPWGRFCFFADPDGNGWSVHEPPSTH
jgi:catechol 2,3-dioxygenase-like lactoylglutathione lyase family enzyme